jgi:ABC-type nitrate/sulfonate/bicarbonate transport system substrate-binding protein
MNSFSLRWRRLAVATATLALSAAALSGCAQPEGDDGDIPTLTIASPAPNSLFTFNEVVARELGFYDDEGIAVEVVAISEALPAASLVQNGNADAALVSASEALSAAAKTTDLVLPYDERTGGVDFIYGIVVPADSGIESLTELAGTNIGLAGPDQDLALLASALEKVGMSLDDVTATVVGPGGSSVAESLRSGRIAGYVGTLADFAAFGDAGLEVENIIPEGLEGLPVGGYVVRAADLDANDDLIKFLRALAKGTFVALERPEIAELVTQKVAPDQWREPEIAQFLIQGLSLTLEPFDGENFGEIKRERWESAQDLLIQVGAMTDPADLDAFLRPDLLAQINDWDRDEVLAQADAWLAENS